MTFRRGQIGIAGSLNAVIGSLDIVAAHGLGHESARFTAEWVFDESLETDIETYRRIIPGRIAAMGMHGISNQARDGANLAHPRKELREHALRRCLQCVDIARRLEARHIVFHQWHRPDRIEGFSRELWLAQAEYWRTVGDRAAAHGITIVLENDFTPDPETALALVEAVDHPAVAAHLDIAHALLNSKVPPSAWIEALGDRLKAVHINNTDGKADCHWPLDKGVIDYRDIMERLQPLADRLIMVVMEIDPNEREGFKSSLALLHECGCLPEEEQA